MILKISFKNIHIDKKLQNILLKKYSRELQYLSKNKLNNLFFKYINVNFPIKRKLYTVLASPHINKKAREQFAITKYIKSINVISYSFYNNRIYNYLFFYKNFIINKLLKNYYTNLYFKNNYSFYLQKNNKNNKQTLKIKFAIK